MVFWRGSREKTSDGPAVKEALLARGATAVGEAQPLPGSELRRVVDPAALGFKTTTDIAPIRGLIGQERALAAIEFGTAMHAMDYNIFVLGPPASGKRTAIKTLLASKASTAAAPDDWAYVYNFRDPSRPSALRMPAGRARVLARAMGAAIDELCGIVPALLEGDDYQSRRRAIDAAVQAGHERDLEKIIQTAASQNVAVLRTPQGFALAPMHDGKVVKPETFNALPEKMRTEKQAQITALEAELSEVLERLPRMEKDRRLKIGLLNEDVGRGAVSSALDDVVAAFATVPAVVAYLQAAREDLVRNIAIFLPQGGDADQPIRQPADAGRDPRYRRYIVNVMVGSASPGGTDMTAGAPVIEEINPSYRNLIGRIEHLSQGSSLFTDFALMKQGALHRANGGYLIMDARRLLASPFAYEALKRALKSQEIRIEQPADESGLGLNPQTLDPEPIPLDIKVILIGEREIYYQLAQNDPDFLGLFKVQVDFHDAIARSPVNELAYAGIVASIIENYKLKPADASGVARIIEEGVRRADDREKVSVEIGAISDLVREADYYASTAGHFTIGRADVETAVAAKIHRADRLRSEAQETVTRGIVLVDTDGGKIGQINGLAVMKVGNFAFGRPSRITARVRMGQGRIVDIEREAKLGGATHTKGVMILSGFIAGRYAKDFPLALAATLTFEQSYGGVDGDSASSTEIYALLSALAEVPIQQGLAVTGSVNQWGEVQAIGGVNEKIEGFFDVCKARELTGRQGVLIPSANVQHLMLREDVVAACNAGQFAVYAISTIDQGIEILTGMPAGDRGTGGEWPAGSVNGRVEARLRGFANHARSFAKVESGAGDASTVPDA